MFKSPEKYKKLGRVTFRGQRKVYFKNKKVESKKSC